MNRLGIIREIQKRIEDKPTARALTHAMHAIRRGRGTDWGNAKADMGPNWKNTRIVAQAGGVALCALLAVSPPSFAEEPADVYGELERLEMIFRQIREQYVDEVEAGALVDAAIDGMLASLDPHSSYLNPEAYNEMQEDTSGEFAGLGIQIQMENGAIKIISPIDDTPAAKAGLQSGDFITHADDEPLMGLTLNEAIERLRGPIGTTVKITIIREGSDEPLDYEIKRAIIRSPSAKVELMIDTVKIRLTQFDEHTYEYMERGIKSAIDEAGGMDRVSGFVLDLRNNPGGLLNMAIEISDAFLEQGEIVSTRGRLESDSGRANARKGDITKGKPLVVLINGGSASASEIVAGALKDQERAIIVGTPSFGKGSVQTILPLPGNESAIKLTTARYYTPSGRSIQGFGVEPDVYIEQEVMGEDEAISGRRFFSENDLRGSLSNDSLSEEEEKELEVSRAEIERIAELRRTDFQLSYAIDILHGLSVYER